MLNIICILRDIAISIYLGLNPIISIIIVSISIDIIIITVVLIMKDT